MYQSFEKWGLQNLNASSILAGRFDRINLVSNSQGSTAVEIPFHFEQLGLHLADLMASDFLDSNTLSRICNKSVYCFFMADLPPPKIVREASMDYKDVWKRLHSGKVDLYAKEVYLLLLHNKLPVPERKFRVGLLKDPYCGACSAAEIADLEHAFCGCIKVSALWSWMRIKLSVMNNMIDSATDWDLLNFFFPSDVNEMAMVWLLSNYVLFVWDRTHVKKVNFDLTTFFGFLTFKYREHITTSGYKLNCMEDFE